MLEIEAIYRQIGIRQNVLAFGGQIEKELKERFEQIDQIAEYNQSAESHTSHAGKPSERGVL